MCRGGHHEYHHHQQKNKNKKKDRWDSLKIKGFNLQLRLSNTTTELSSWLLLPDYLSLQYYVLIPPGSRPLDMTDSAVFVTLDRVVSRTSRVVNFASREGVEARGGVRFEVYMGDQKLLSGTLKKNDDDDNDDEWKLDCKCVLESELVGSQLREAQVSVEAQGLAITQTVDMLKRVQRMMRMRKRNYKCSSSSSSSNFKGGLLEEIPEEEEEEDDFDEGDEIGIIAKAEGGGRGRGRGREDEEGNLDDERIMEMEGVKWAVDVGIWVICFGVGYFLSKASSKTRLLLLLTRHTLL